MVVLRISGIRRRGWHRVHRSGDLWYDMLVTVWCAVPFQNLVVIPNVLQVCELWFQLVQRCLIVFFLLLQAVVFRRQLFQRRHLSIERRVNRLGIL